jgi:hypothetical protein
MSGPLRCDGVSSTTRNRPCNALAMTTMFFDQDDNCEDDTVQRVAMGSHTL